MKTSGLKQKTLTGLVWSSVESFSFQGTQFFIGLVLARLLAPSDYGLVGVLAIFVAISQTFINSGFSSALIQKNDRDELDFSTVFYFNIAVSALFYLLLFFLAPFVSRFYDEPALTMLLRVLGIVVVVNSFSVVQRSILVIKLDFKTMAKASFFAGVVAGAVGIGLAYRGAGVWALVAKTLLTSLINVLVLWSVAKWVPCFRFSFRRFRGLFSFGSKLLASSLIETLYRNIYALVIGKYFSVQALGFFYRARQFAVFPSENLTAILQRVTFPVLSKLQDDDEKLRVAYKKIIQTVAWVVFPLMLGLVVQAKPLILVVLTEKWLESVWMLQLLCFALMWQPISSLSLNVINVKGRSGLFLKLEVVKKIIISAVLIASIPFGIKVMLLGQIITSIIGLFIDLYYTRKIIGYGFLNQIRDILPAFMLAVGMGGSVFYMNSFIDSNLLKLFAGTFLGALLYFSGAWCFNIAETRKYSKSAFDFAVATCRKA